MRINFNLASTLLKVLWSQWSLLDHVYARIFRSRDDASISNICGKIVEPFQIVFSIKCKVFCKNCTFLKNSLLFAIMSIKWSFFKFMNLRQTIKKQIGTFKKKSSVTNCIYQNTNIWYILKDLQSFLHFQEIVKYLHR